MDELKSCCFTFLWRMGLREEASFNSIEERCFPLGLPFILLESFFSRMGRVGRKGEMCVVSRIINRSVKSSDFQQKEKRDDDKEM